jgi:hypothetical protein
MVSVKEVTGKKQERQEAGGKRKEIEEEREVRM